ncbi:MAG: hypothetical protein J5787_09120 [Alphaproteobacteria bacterium]|nr:hypothetical protein [Alphaproteobacteria bacterium]
MCCFSRDRLIPVLEKRLRKVVKRQCASFYDGFLYKIYKRLTKKAPDKELLNSVQPVLRRKTGKAALLKETRDAILETADLLKYSLLPAELRAARYSGKISDIDETLKYQSYQDCYKISLRKLRLKHEAGQKIRVGFLVVFDSVFQLESLYLKMLKDDFFTPGIVVVPHKNFGLDRVEKTYAALKEKYGENVVSGFNKELNDYINFDDRFDLVTTMNPYEEYAHPLSSTRHFAEAGIPSFFVNYMPFLTEGQHIMRKQAQKNLTWKIFAQEKYELDSLTDNHLAGTNVVSLGWPKMDALAEIKKKKRNRKKIILAPHHSLSINTYHPKTATFEKYAEFFLTLPEKYPQIDWVFRPHPVLFDNLKKLPGWGEEKCRDYISKMASFPNVEYQDGGDYFETFVNSDGLIHDCMSFLAEYMFTGHPCCFLKKQEGYQNVNEFFEKCVNNHYAAFDENDITSFIENIVLNGDDTMKESRQAFFETYIKGSYPNATEAVLEYLKDEIRNA